ncbi:unnamed protein product [Camellia sinensis]
MVVMGGRRRRGGGSVVGGGLRSRFAIVGCNLKKKRRRGGNEVGGYGSSIEVAGVKKKEERRRNAAGWLVMEVAVVGLMVVRAPAIGRFVEEKLGVEKRRDMVGIKMGVQKGGCQRIKIHGFQVDVTRSENAVQANMELEFQRNKKRFAFLKLGSNAFHNMLVVPPGSGIMHQEISDEINMRVKKYLRDEGDNFEIG